ncbi:MAG: maf [Conexibacter sp.]|nr:maf [Conexibacter sp.]
MTGSGDAGASPLGEPKPRLVLASGSPQRRAILNDLGLDFDVRPSDVAEEDEGPPRVVASENALRKALAISGAAGPDAHEVVLGCDTLVATELEIADLGSRGRGASGHEIADLGRGSRRRGASGHEIWGKPPNEDAARETLRRLSGRTHEVVSGLVLVQRGDVRAATEVTRVTFRELDEATIEWYLGCGEWEGRAGGYAIQGRGAALIKRIEGDYLNVVGLPVAALIDLCPGLMTDHAAPSG